jgi:hypothetical protein
MASEGERTADSELGASQESTGPEHAAQERLVGSPLIKLARFKNGTLELFEACLKSTDYIAFSHV